MIFKISIIFLTILFIVSCETDQNARYLREIDGERLEKDKKDKDKEQDDDKIWKW